MSTEFAIVHQLTDLWNPLHWVWLGPIWVTSEKKQQSQFYKIEPGRIHCWPLFVLRFHLEEVNYSHFTMYFFKKTNKNTEKGHFLPHLNFSLVFFPILPSTNQTKNSMFHRMKNIYIGLLDLSHYVAIFKTFSSKGPLSISLVCGNIHRSFLKDKGFTKIYWASNNVPLLLN